MIDELIIENVRCFASRQTIPLAPLTVLVGENSCGKSTFLALCRLAWDALFGVRAIDFNEEPFTLGAYNEIAHYRGGRVGRADSFTVGLGAARALLGPRKEPDSNGFVCATATFRRKVAEPVLTDLHFDSPPLRVSASKGGTDREPRVDMVTHDEKKEAELSHMGWPGPLNLIDLGRILFRHGVISTRAVPPESKHSTVATVEQRLEQRVREFRRAIGARPSALAPIRTHPERTYHPTSYDPRPGGGHVPLVLNRTLSTRPDEWRQLLEALDNFGRACGLFDAIAIRRLGEYETDPFQLQVKIAGPAFNLVDVGYGVSQVLPILVDALTREPRGPLLLQQPEVHLHPRAQAELASFLAAVSKHRATQFVVETHSDHFIDRVRMDIRDAKTSSAKDVSLLYFERAKGIVNIHRIEIDDDGNVVDPPRGYRAFFLHEELRLLKG